MPNLEYSIDDIYFELSNNNIYKASKIIILLLWLKFYKDKYVIFLDTDYIIIGYSKIFRRIFASQIYGNDFAGGIRTEMLRER